jgi:hypothetical protein
MQSPQAETVRVEKWKWPRDPTGGRPKISWDARVVAQDEFGTWLHCPKGAQHRRDDGAVITLPCDAIQLLPARGWWAAWWWADEQWVSVDVSTPPEKHGSTWRYVDLELDFALLADGAVHLVDQEEFDEAVNAGRIPQDVARDATNSATSLMAALTVRQEPFRHAGWRRLAEAQYGSTP